MAITLYNRALTQVAALIPLLAPLWGYPAVYRSTLYGGAVSFIMLQHLLWWYLKLAVRSIL